MSTDLTFITNEDGKDLASRFSDLIKDTKNFDVLVGYFYASGFHMLYKELEKTEKIRVLIGIGTDIDVFSAIKEAEGSRQMTLSHYDTRQEFSKRVAEEMEWSKDSPEVEDGIRKFIEWLKDEKIEIRVYPKESIHAKLYIMTFKEGDRDKGRVITGSSNFSKSGLKGNIEFNVELKNRSDYEFALEKFNELWEESVDVSEEYVQTIKEKTWLNDEITPYELYLKFLYEYFMEEINLDKEEFLRTYLPQNFMDLKYQRDAVAQAKKILEQHGGVFLSDVVGLGKTYMAAMLAQQLDGRTLVIAPPSLIREGDPGSWPSILLDFGVPARCESIGKLDKIIEEGHEQYKNIIIDEAHRFRTETTQMYEKLYRICKGKRIILVTATPLNNRPEDILAQIKLFQDGHKSTLPNPKVRDLEAYFKKLNKGLKRLDRKKDRDEYLRIVRENAEDIRKNVLQYLMVRRTRSAIMKYYGKDMKNQGLKFPEVQDPEPVVYNFDEALNHIFDETVKMIANDFRYARYKPLLYLKDTKNLTTLERQSQMNMGNFMKILLLKRLESSFYAFKMSIDRFIHSYEGFIASYEKGHVFLSKKHMNKILELLDKDDMESIAKLIEEDRATEFDASDFIDDFIRDLRHDLKILRKIQDMWKAVDRDPKIDMLLKRLSEDETLKKRKLVLFTESKETAEYVSKRLDKVPRLGKVMLFSSASGPKDKERMSKNFDANVKKERQENDIKILVTTDVLSEGVNLHRSNVVINYDIPWNPVRMIQRVGRVNRVGKNLPFNKIYVYNFFPAGPINENISLKEAAESKIRAFIEMLGNDARLLTDEDVKSHDLFVKLSSRETITGEEGEEDEELKYLTFIRKIRDEEKGLFERIKNMPRKVRTAKRYEHKEDNALVTFFRKGKIKKIFIARDDGVKEIDFVAGAHILESRRNAKREKMGRNFYALLEKNKRAFDEVIRKEPEEPIQKSGGKDLESWLGRIIKAILRPPNRFTDEEEEYLREVRHLLEIGGIPKQTLKKIKKDMKDKDPHRIYSTIKRNLPEEVFKKTFAEDSEDEKSPREVILSEYLIKKEKVRQ